MTGSSLESEESKVLSTSDTETESPSLLNSLMLQAIKSEATDIHIEPASDKVRVRFRINGSLVEQPPLNRGVLGVLTTRIKLLARMDIHETQRPQNGTFRFTAGLPAPTSIRVSTYPCLHGEKIVARLILDEELLSLDKIGMEAQQIKLLHHLTRQQGLVVVTGPWSSGKTATLYVLAKELSSSEYNVVTLEDPIEYELPGINQAQVSRQSGFTFANGMRAILRQDPDIIMLGEIWDFESAKAATDACLQGGHRVISSIHTDSAMDCLSWLTNTGIRPHIIANALSGIIVQRLVRRICIHCKETITLSAQTREEIGFPVDANQTWFAGRGCKHCRLTGYMGRTGIFEIIEMNEEIRDAIKKDAGDVVVKKAFRKQGIETIRRVGIKKATMGITTVSEVIRVT